MLTKEANTKLSKVWVVLSDDAGTIKGFRKELAYEYDSQSGSPSNFTYPIGIVFDHNEEPNVHHEGSPRRSFGCNPIISGVDNLVGQLLTLADATFTDLNQRKAFKDIVKKTVWGWNMQNENRVDEVFKFLLNKKSCKNGCGEGEGCSDCR
jgi:hypothetical protein